jgi:hypothetical protein
MQGIEKAIADTLVDADRVRRAVAVALEPDLKQLAVDLGVGVQRRQAVDVGSGVPAKRRPSR